MLRPQKTTLAEMRDSGVRGVLVYCSDWQPFDRDQRGPMA
jgi:hypothetical protein